MSGTGKRDVDLKSRAHQCPANGCETPVDRSKLMCGPHWRIVPEPLARAVYAAWRHGHGYGTEAHAAACDAAIDAVNRHLAAGGGR